METDARIEALAGDGFMPHCGIELKLDVSGGVFAEFTAGEQHKNSHGFINGGMLFTLADIAGGACISEAGKDIMSLDADFHFLRNVKSGQVFARPSIIRKGRRISVVGVSVEDEAGNLLASSTFTYYTAE